MFNLELLDDEVTFNGQIVYQGPKAQKAYFALLDEYENRFTTAKDRVESGRRSILFVDLRDALDNCLE
jgi:hypothetical protein